MSKVNVANIAHAYEISDNRPQQAQLTAKQKAASTSDKTLVFVHGWLLSQSYWQPLVEALSTRYRCLTYDLRGFGDSSSGLSASSSHQIDLPQVNLTQERSQLSTQSSNNQPSYTVSPYSLAAYAQDLEQLLDKLNIEKAWVIGHSLGGSIALWSAYLFPKRVQGVVCVNAGGGIYIPKEFEKFRSAGQQMVKFRPNWLRRLPLLPNAFSRLMVKQPLSRQWGQQRILDFVRADRAAAEGSLLETTTETEVHLMPQVVGQVTQPVHFITATEDSIMPPKYVRYLASFHTHFSEETSVSEIANCGHMAMLEQTQAVAKIIDSVLAKY